MDAMSAVDSPHTKAPAPRTTLIEKSWPLPRMFSPEQAVLLGLLRGAVFRCSTARGYSLRT